MGILQLTSRKIGASDIAFGLGAFSWVDENGISHTASEVNASNLPMADGRTVQAAIDVLNATDVAHYGATGNGTTDDTAALNDALADTAAGGYLYLPPGVYKTTGWLIDKSVSLFSPTSLAFSTLNAATIKAAGAQDYVVKFQGALGDGSGTSFIHTTVQGINLSGGNFAISDALMVMEFCHLPLVWGCSFQSAVGRAIRLLTTWELRLQDFYIAHCGTDGGYTVYLDGPNPFVATQGCSDISMKGGIWAANKGKWLYASAMANVDGFWFIENKMELDDLTIVNSLSENVIHMGAMSRGWIQDNSFANFGANFGNYGNLIYVNGDASSTFGNSGSHVIKNHLINATGAGAVNGLYLGKDCPTIIERDNTAITVDGLTCPNVNVSEFPQLIGKSWRSFATTLFPVGLPDREVANFISIHTVARGTFNETFVVDANCANNAGTVLALDVANQANAKICASYDLSRYVGHPATNLLVRLRMRLNDVSGGESVTVRVIPTAPDSFPTDVTVNAATWAWYTATCTMANITTTGHLLNVYLWSIDVGAPTLYIDGMEFATS